MCQGQHPFVGHGRRSLCDGHASLNGNPDPKQNGYLLIIAHMSKVGSKATSDPCPVGRDKEVFVFLSDWAAGNVFFLGKLFFLFFFLGLGIRELFFFLLGTAWSFRHPCHSPATEMLAICLEVEADITSPPAKRPTGERMASFLQKGT